MPVKDTKNAESYIGGYRKIVFFPRNLFTWRQNIVELVSIVDKIKLILGKQEMVQIILREVLSVTHLAGMHLIIGVF